MKKNKLGRTDVEVTEICLGTMTWGQQNSEAEAHAQIDYALEQGVNFMDTAEMYAVPPSAETYGKTEEYIGSWFKNTGKRDQWVLASKMAGPGRPWVRDGARPTIATMREAVENSLKRLQTDHIDLYQIHWPTRGHYHFENYWDYDANIQNRETAVEQLQEILEGADTLIKEGKIRHLGLSNETAWGIMKYLSLSETHGLPRVVSVQNEYSLLRRLYDHDLAELSHHEDVGLLAYSPLAAGVISGKYLGGALPEGTRGAWTGGIYRHNEFSEPAIRCYMNLARDHGLDVCQMALAFALSRPFMTSVIIGATSMEQLKSDIGAADITLDEQALRGIASLHRRFPRTV